MASTQTTRDRTGLDDTPPALHTELFEFPEFSTFPQVRHYFSSVIFDFDGTLADSLWVWDDIDVRFCEIYDLTVPDDYYEKIDAMTFEETAVYFIEELGLDMPAEEILYHFNEMAYDRYAHEVKLLPGVKEYLELLKTRGVTMGIATSLTWPLLEAAMKNNGIDGYFDDIAFCDESASKEKPDVYLLAAERIGARPKDCIVFEDAPSGIASARSAGMAACQVVDKRRTALPTGQDDGADFWIENFAGLAEGAGKALL